MFMEFVKSQYLLLCVSCVTILLLIVFTIVLYAICSMVTRFQFRQMNKHMRDYTKMQCDYIDWQLKNKK